MAMIPLTHGKFALVDDEDFERVTAYKWYFTHNGYAARTTERPNRVMIYMHRFIMNAPADMEVDHINGDRLDNRRKSLRLASRAENQYNQKIRTDGTSQYKGVHWHKAQQKWQAQIQVNGKRITLGFFADEIEAAKAYDTAACRHYGEFAYVNFPVES